MGGPWILPQLKDMPVNIVVVNNSGGKIFDRMFPDKEVQNEHALNFQPLAAMWNLAYQALEQGAERILGAGTVR